MKTGIEQITDERQRQTDILGWTPEHDDTHANHELAKYAAIYAMPASERRLPIMENLNPFGKSLQDPITDEDRIHELVKAGSLIVAEIERLQRLLVVKG